MKALVAVLFMFVMFTLSYLGMTLGWGLEVKSWAWLVGTWLGIMFVTLVGKVMENE